MSKPTFENIDQWLFEFTEGNLSPMKESQLMDFLSDHPELMEELKLWRHAKASPINTPEVNVQALTKASPLILAPLSLVSIGIIGFLLAGLAIYYFPSHPQYSISHIDANIISIEFEEDGYGETYLKSAYKTKNSGNYLVNHKISEEKNEVSHHSQILNKASQSLKNKDAKISKSINVNNTSSLSKEERGIKGGDEYPTTFNSSSHIMLKANELNDVIAYLNREIVGKTEEDFEETKSASNIASTKVTQRRTFSNFTRKIKKMIDQPTALRNTKTPYFHTPMMTGFKANPGMVGSALGNRIQATSRLQWYHKENEQIMNSLSWDGYIYNLRGGIGVDVNYNTYKGNSLNNYSVGLVYSPKFSINSHISFEPALSFKMGVIDIDPNSKYIGNKIEMQRSNSLAFFEGEEEATGSQLWYKDVGLGFMLNTKSFYIGFNADNLGRHNNNYYSNDINKNHREEIHYTAIIGTEYQSLTKDISVNGYGLFQNYGNLNELWLGANFRYKWLHLGSGMNTDLDFGLSAGATIHRVSLHYNIDHINSELLNKKVLSHQLTLRVLLKPNRYAVKFLNL